MRQKKNLLTADFSTSQDWGGRDSALWHKKPSCAAGSKRAERKKGGGETRGTGS